MRTKDESQRNNHLVGIAYKVVATFLFTVMSSLVRGLGEAVPVGQVVFFRSLFALIPIFAVLYWQLGPGLWRLGSGKVHFLRSAFGCASMFFLFAGLQHVPLAEATALNYVMPFMTVALAAFFLGERVGPARWLSVASGFCGVVVMLFPSFRGAGVPLDGALYLLMGALLGAAAMIQIRSLTARESVGSIVVFFTLTCLLAGTATLPFGFQWPDGKQTALLIAVGLTGGVAQLFMTASYGRADASVIAPYDYTSMLWALGIGFLMFGEIPPMLVAAGAAIVALSGLLLALHERLRNRP